MNTLVGCNLTDAVESLQQLASLESQMLAAADTISDALLSGNKLMACGNGGSAARDLPYRTARRSGWHRGRTRPRVRRPPRG